MKLLHLFLCNYNMTSYCADEDKPQSVMQCVEVHPGITYSKDLEPFNNSIATVVGTAQFPFELLDYECCTPPGGCLVGLGNYTRIFQ